MKDFINQLFSTPMLVTYIVFLSGINIVALFEAWRLNDQKKSLKSKIKQNERNN